ncbi:MAG: hypothetical protein OJF60_002532 [Burkholderiaceae bacterium]|jgi:hypothetical protein|nr:MAG: hypothetical protein OJF60_002532 [Burkholderiaceae bacterium]
MNESLNLEAQYAEQESRKRDAGRYTIKEAAEILDREAGERKETLVEKLKAAAKAGTLPVYGPGENARYEYPPGRPVRAFYEQIYSSDLNKWLEAQEPRITFRFSVPGTRADTSAPKPLQRHRAQEEAILAKIQELGYDPVALPARRPGRPGAKANVKAALGDQGIWAGRTVFDKAWERLRRADQIKDQNNLPPE